MIISVNTKPELSEFKQLMQNMDQALNIDAIKRPDYYVARGGNLLEDDVVDALTECAKGTPFQGTIEKVSGQRFPDIAVAKFYGVEVKSTKEDHWKSTGSSILETTRVADIERIYMTFGKLGGNPIKFISKPYEECLCGIAVTHMPRYLIDMRLRQGETIFDKMGISYDELRRMDKPFIPVSQYYRSQLKQGESLWWAGDADALNETVSATIRLWHNVNTEDKRRFTAYGCANFPEVFGGNYDRYALWLTSQGVVDPHIRDQFSAGGQEEMLMPNGERVKFPGVYRRIKIQRDYFIRCVVYKDLSHNQWRQMDEDTVERKLFLWCKEASRISSVDYNMSMDALSMLFFGCSASEIEEKLKNNRK